MLKPIASWIDEQSKTNTPFFLAVMTNVGHHKYGFPTYWKKKVFVRDEDENDYLNCISYIDDFLSRLFSEFSERKLLDSTIFVILGDHGDSFGEHQVRLRALTLYEDELHVPMLIFAPSLYPNGGKLSGAHQQVDVLPTIADLLGYTIEGGGIPGSSIIAETKISKPLFFSTIMDNMSLAMLRGSQKYIYNFDRSPMEVYDLALDKSESRNIARNMSSADLDRAEREMLSWSRKVRVSFGQ
jgi:arylsulfatase A-like enzyme